MKNDTYIFPQSNHAQNKGGFDNNSDINNHNQYLDRINQENQRQQMIAERLNVVNFQRHLDDIRNEAVDKYLENIRSKGLIALLDLVQKKFVTNSNSDKSSKKQQIRNKFLEAESNLAGSMFITNDNRTHYFHYHDNSEWFWHNRTTDPNVVPTLSDTVRYYVDIKHGIYKSENGSDFKEVSEIEHQRFIEAATAYIYIVTKHIYKTDIKS